MTAASPTMPSKDETQSKSYAAAAATDPSDAPKENGVENGNAVAQSNGVKAHNGADKPSGAVNGHESAGSKAQNGSGGKKSGKKAKRKEEDEHKIEYEEHRDANGTHLVSIKPQDGYEDEQREDKLETPKREPEKNELISGRQAGQGWERSG